jgi:hypothetical protein
MARSPEKRSEQGQGSGVLAVRLHDDGLKVEETMGGLTAWQALFVHGRLARGERVLVAGASGGVGHIAVQLARHAGATVVESGPVDLSSTLVAARSPLASARSRSQRRCRARSTSSSSPTTSNCWS